jgi:hypothetical protein
MYLFYRFGILPSGIFASFQQSTLAGKRQKAATINCVNSILAMLASQPVCTIIDAGMQYLSMLTTSDSSLTQAL